MQNNDIGINQKISTCENGQQLSMIYDVRKHS